MWTNPQFSLDFSHLLEKYLTKNLIFRAVINLKNSRIIQVFSVDLYLK